MQNNFNDNMNYKDFSNNNMNNRNMGNNNNMNNGNMNNNINNNMINRHMSNDINNNNYMNMNNMNNMNNINMNNMNNMNMNNMNRRNILNNNMNNNNMNDNNMNNINMNNNMNSNNMNNNMIWQHPYLQKMMNEYNKFNNDWKVESGREMKQDEVNIITLCVLDAFNRKADPLSREIIHRIKQILDGDWVVFACVDGLKGYDLSVSLDNGNRTVSLIVDNFLFQIIKLSD